MNKYIYYTLASLGLSILLYLYTSCNAYQPTSSLANPHIYSNTHTQGEFLQMGIWSQSFGLVSKMV